MIRKTVLNSLRIVISYVMKRNPVVNGFPSGGKVIVEQKLASEEIKKSKRAGL